MVKRGRPCLATLFPTTLGAPGGLDSIAMRLGALTQILLIETPPGSLWQKSIGLFGLLLLESGVAFGAGFARHHTRLEMLCANLFLEVADALGRHRLALIADVFVGQAFGQAGDPKSALKEALLRRRRIEPKRKYAARDVLGFDRLGRLGALRGSARLGGGFGLCRSRFRWMRDAKLYHWRDGRPR